MSYGIGGNRLAIETLSLSRKFGKLVAVDGIDLSVREGELFSLLGPNGAGFSEIAADLYWVIGYTVAFFALGTLLFRRKMAE